MSTKIIRNIFLFLLGFLGLGAVGGGGTLIISPSGELIGMPISMLEESPFSSFLIPGVILSLVLGLIPLLLIIALLRKPESKLAERFNLFKDMHWAWAYSIYIGFILIIWIQLQIVFIQEVSLIHTFYVFLAVTILYTALLPQIRNLYRK
jgi:TRAP-type C4-dicarboxylate transport system permease large subunit